MTADAKLLDDQAFIYFRHSATGVEMFAARRLIRKIRMAGTTKTHYERVPAMKTSDPMAAAVQGVMSGMVRRAKAVLVVNERPTAENLIKFAAEVAAAQGVEVEVVQPDGRHPLRVVVRAEGLT